MIQTNKKEINILTEEEIKSNKYVRGLIVRATTYSDCLCEPYELPLRIRIGPGPEGVWVSYLIDRKSGKVEDIPCRRFKSNNQTINLEKFYVHQQINSLDAEFTRYKKDCKKGKELGIWDHIPESELRKEEQEKITVYRGRKNLLETMMNRLEMTEIEYNRLEKTTISHVDLKQDKVNEIEMKHDNLEGEVKTCEQGDWTLQYNSKLIYTKRNLLFGTSVFDYRVYNKDKSKDILVRKSTDSPKEMLEVFKKSPEELYDLMNNVTYELDAI